MREHAQAARVCQQIEDEEGSDRHMAIQSDYYELHQKLQNVRTGHLGCDIVPWG